MDAWHPLETASRVMEEILFVFEGKRYPASWEQDYGLGKVIYPAAWA